MHQQSIEHTLSWTDSDGYAYSEKVPDIWLAGFCTHNRCTVDDAITYWMSQSELGRKAS